MAMEEQIIQIQQTIDFLNRNRDFLQIGLKPIVDIFCNFITYDVRRANRDVVDAWSREEGEEKKILIQFSQQIVRSNQAVIEAICKVESFIETLETLLHTGQEKNDERYFEKAINKTKNDMPFILQKIDEAVESTKRLELDYSQVLTALEKLNKSVHASVSKLKAVKKKGILMERAKKYIGATAVAAAITIPIGVVAQNKGYSVPWTTIIAGASVGLVCYAGAYVVTEMHTIDSIEINSQKYVETLEKAISSYAEVGRPIKHVMEHNATLFNNLTQMRAKLSDANSFAKDIKDDERDLAIDLQSFVSKVKDLKERTSKILEHVHVDELIGIADKFNKYIPEESQ